MQPFKHADYIDYQFKYKSPYSSRDGGSFDYVQIMENVVESSDRKLLFVLDYVPTEDLHSGRLLSGATGTLFARMFYVAKKYYNFDFDINSVNFLVVSYHSMKTKGKPDSFVKGAQTEFSRRLRSIITKYKPDTVVTFGPDPYKALNMEHVSRYGSKYQHFYGVPIDTTVVIKNKEGKRSHKFKHFPTLSLNTMINDSGKGNEIALVGYMVRNLINALNGDLLYRVPKLDYQTVLVDSIKKFDKMMATLKTKKRVAIDTETENLNRRVNKMLTIQFAYSKNRAFVLPYLHKDTPFTGSELNYIKDELRKFFEHDNENEVHVYANGSFDLTVIRNATGVRYFKNKIWDLFAGEFALDENMKSLSGVTGNYYYSLLNISMQYGCTAYYEAEFGKDKRKTIAQVDLDRPLLEYCSLDVIVPLHVMDLQLRRGADEGYEKYYSIVTDQISDMIHDFSTFEYNGAYTDIDYLFYLKTKESPIRKEMEEIQRRLYATKGVRKVNELLAKRKGVPTVGLFGRSDVNLFDIGKQDHQQMLFFEVLKLKPVDEARQKGFDIKNHKGKFKINKRFQEAYQDVEEVKLFSELQKSKKLFNAYVKSFIKQWGSDDDMRFDRRIRPHFEFLDVVTGRTSAKKPSLQQIPSRSVLGKHIKRVFITEEGRIMIKVDYSAHEVRCWSLFTGDTAVADLFRVGLDLRSMFKIAPSPELAKEIEYKGDVHRLNASYFFGVPLEEVIKDKALRNAVKTVIFGLIYQQGMKGLSESTKRTIEEITQLVAQFKEKYPVGVSWFDDIKTFGKKNLYVESPLGRRRHVWGHIIPDDAPRASGVKARNERQSVNAPIQGMGSDFLIIGARQIERLKFEEFQKTGHYPDFYQANSVHDSIIFSCAYEDFWTAIRLIEQGLTTEVAKVAKERHGMEFTIPLEIDFEIGANERDVKGWDYSLESMDDIILKTLKSQVEEHGHEIDVAKVHKLIMSKQYEQMPDWAKKQCWNMGAKLKGMSADIRKKSEKAQVKPLKKKEKAA